VELADLGIEEVERGFRGDNSPGDQEFRHHHWNVDLGREAGSLFRVRDTQLPALRRRRKHAPGRNGRVSSIWGKIRLEAGAHKATLTWQRSQSKMRQDEA